MFYLLNCCTNVDDQGQNGQHKYACTYDKVGDRQGMTVTDSGGTKIHVYTYDDSGNMTADGTYTYDYNTITKYVYDGDHCIAEYDTSGNLRRKYIYGPSVDEPISMIEAAGSYAGTYYYHFDGLGSVVALTSGNVDHMGETVQVYEYDVYGRLGATDASHPNRILFTGREYDKETGLYYYRARYYNPRSGDSCKPIR